MLLQPKDSRDHAIVIARQKFFDDGIVPESDVSPVILRSWQRCRDSGLNHLDSRPLDPVGRLQLAESRERNGTLLAHAGGVMEHVFDQIRASGSMVMLADVDGTIIHSLGDPSFVDRAGRVALQAGACWSEKLRGTNGIGTAIEDRMAVEVLGSEHYLDRNGFLTCSAAPIFGTDGELVGVLDISGDFRNPQRHTLGLVRLSVQLLEKRLFEACFPNDILIAFHPRPEYLGSLQEGLLALGADGSILGANGAAREWLARARRGAPVSSFASFFKIGFGAILDRASMAPNALLKLDLREGGEIYLQVRSLRPLMVANPHMQAMAPSAAAVPAVAEARPKAPAAGGAGRSADVSLSSLAIGDERLQRALDRAMRIEGKGIPLLIQGESGVGKELFARAFHNSGPRADGPFVAVNCAAIPENLIESELFGYVGGAFTGARREGSIGKVQLAHGGTLFLDEIGDMPLAMQTRLLRVLQERCVTPVGSTKSLPVDISLVCATHHALREAVAAGEFREDLYYRINGLTVTLPPLRERSDIRALVQSIFDVELEEVRRSGVSIGEEVMGFFERYAWPGNIRQLHNVLRLAVALMDEDEDELCAIHLPEDLFGSEPFDHAPSSARSAAAVELAAADAAPAAEGGRLKAEPRSLDEIKLEAITSVMREVGGNISAAARRLGVSRNTLYRKLGRMH
ncbi:sigma-54-dependent Fis family transcriptional regulator [Thauera sinica]|uniref:Sigma-54-dependent Fis family transcriptional regulator n=1 Tax=Thauera sinica TaxID=2665146 RepID=A0ABW1AL65_9RHOO|nr:sigma-54-dependent Fis family transcriptional regulator [Thauera sp. K11]ATE60770.1 sigma-54-dependent Fis family transcriptional regulator [Thauera sp. K11]